jgi:broad specificity phosphatase PhoE
MRCLFFSLVAAALLTAGSTEAQHTMPQDLAAVAPTPDPAAPGRVAQLIDQMRAGGLVLVIRHERTEVPSRDDDYTRPAHDCTAQRNLSLAGLAGAQETGVALRALGVPIGAVISSPMCRTTETARMMFGGYRVDPRLIHPNADVPGGRGIEPAGEEFLQILRETVSGSGNTVVISHGGNIFKATGLHLAEGEIGVLRLGPARAVEVLGQVVGSDLGGHARVALVNARQ